MNVHVRQAKPVDRDQLARLRKALWPETSAEEHARELEPILAGQTPGSMPLVNFVAETSDGRLLGFAEVDLRSHGDGCSPSLPVGYLEGWYVAEEARDHGIGRRLLSAAEDWARSHGCVEMASDTWIDNQLSQTCHEALGFEVVDRCVHYRRTLSLRFCWERAPAANSELRFRRTKRSRLQVRKIPDLCRSFSSCL